MNKILRQNVGQLERVLSNGKEINKAYGESEKQRTMSEIKKKKNRSEGIRRRNEERKRKRGNLICPKCLGLVRIVNDRKQ